MKSGDPQFLAGWEGRKVAWWEGHSSPSSSAAYASNTDGTLTTVLLHNDQ